MSDTPQPTLRRATVDDAARLSELGARLFAQSFGAANDADNMQSYLAGAFSDAKQRAELTNADCVVWLAEDSSGTPIGYAMLWHGGAGPGVTGHHPAEVRRVYADRDWHGRGLGPALMHACVAQARDWNCDVIWLGVWEENPRAIAFYEKIGFRKVGRQTFRLGRDVQHDFVMALTL